jgi:hypothetical protein
MYTALKSLTSFSLCATLHMNMSNDIKLAVQGALARAASSSAAVNVAHLFRGEAFAFSLPACLQPAAAVYEERRIPSLAHEIKSPNYDM